MIIALLFILAGIVFFAKALGFNIGDDTVGILWPLVLIIVGISLLSHKILGHSCSDKDCWRCCEIKFPESKATKKKKK